MLRSVEAEVAARLPDAGARWGVYSLQTRQIVQRFKTALETIHYAQKLQGSFESRHEANDLVAYASMFEGILKDEFPEFSQHLSAFGEVLLALPDTVTIMSGRLVSSPVLSHTYNIMRCLQHLRPQTVLDIGGGTGSAGRLWLTNPIHRPSCYIDFDLPESLFFSEVYLRTFLSDAQITYVHEERDLVRAAPSRQQVFLIPVHNYRFVSDLETDLVVNTGSMQEMTTEYIDFYMEMIQASKANYFYSSNYFAQKIDLLLESMNYAAPALGADWISVFRKWHPDPTRGVAEILFQRSASAEPIDAELQRLLDTVQIENEAAFLEIFDFTRRVDKPGLIMSAVKKAKNELGFVPKELLWLARRARGLAPNSAEIVAELEKLERLALQG